jgi:hypothetical protein
MALVCLIPMKFFFRDNNIYIKIIKILINNNTRIKTVKNRIEY